MIDIPKSPATPIDTAGKAWDAAYGAPETTDKPKEEMKRTVEIETADPKGRVKKSKASKPKAKKTAKKPAAKKDKPNTDQKPALKSGPRADIPAFRGELTCAIDDLVATGKLSADGITVFKGSQAVLTVNKKVQDKTPSRFKQRNALIESGVLVKDVRFYVFTKDHLFTSPTVAAVTIQGQSANGLAAFKSKDGIRLKDIGKKSH